MLVRTIRVLRTVTLMRHVSMLLLRVSHIHVVVQKDTHSMPACSSVWTRTIVKVIHAAAVVTLMRRVRTCLPVAALGLHVHVQRVTSPTILLVWISIDVPQIHASESTLQQSVSMLLHPRIRTHAHVPQIDSDLMERHV